MRVFLLLNACVCFVRDVSCGVARLAVLCVVSVLLLIGCVCCACVVVRVMLLLINVFCVFLDCE